MTNLEQTLISLAREELEAVTAFYLKQSKGNVTKEDRDDFNGHYQALHVLLLLGHLADSGMSAEGALAMRDVEDLHSKAFRTTLPLEKQAAQSAATAEPAWLKRLVSKLDTQTPRLRVKGNLMFTKALHEQQLENWVFSSDPAEVRQKFDQATGVQREMMESIIVGFISLGDSPLGHAFPEFHS